MKRSEMSNSQQILEALLSTFKDWKDFLKSELPDIGKEILTYDFWEALIHIISYVIILVTSCFAISKIYNYIIESSLITEDRQFFLAAAGVITFFVIIVIISGLLDNVLNIIQIKTAPKYYLTEKIIKLNRNKGK